MFSCCVFFSAGLGLADVGRLVVDPYDRDSPGQHLRLRTARKATLDMLHGFFRTHLAPHQGGSRSDTDLHSSSARACCVPTGPAPSHIQESIALVQSLKDSLSGISGILRNLELCDLCRDLVPSSRHPHDDQIIDLAGQEVSARVQAANTSDYARV